MRNIKLTIEYDGTNYLGWQTQNTKQAQRQKANTIQQTLEQSLHKILNEQVVLIASGRTDSGVHAKGQIANFKTNNTLLPEKIALALNTLLPRDIAIIDAKEVALDFHARFDAKAKTYRYTIVNRKYRPALFGNHCFYVRTPLNVNLMKQEAGCLIGSHDFKSFQAADHADKSRNSKTTIKKILLKKHGDTINIDIEATGFLYNMARIICGTLIDIGRGKLEIGALKKILHKKDRRYAAATAPARGLCLIEVKY